MISLKRITYLLLYLMLLSPILSYITFGLMGLMSITYYFTQFTFFYGIIFIIVKGKTAKIPSFLYLFIIYSVYQSIWSFANGGFERRGLFQILVNRDMVATVSYTHLTLPTNREV